MDTSLLKSGKKLKILWSDVPVLLMASRDKRTPSSTKWMTLLSVMYLFSPIDIVPDVVPILGWLDDLLLVPLLFSFAIRTVPLEVLTDARTRVRKAKTWSFIIFLLLALALLVYFSSPYILREFQ